MRNLRVFVAGAGAPRSLRPLWREIVERHPSPDFSDVGILTPHRAHIRNNRRVLMETTPGSALVPPRQMPLEDWLLSLLPETLVPLSEEERTLILADVLLQDPDRWSSLLLKQERIRLPQARQILRVLDDLRLWAFERSPEDLRKTIEDEIGTYPHVARRAQAVVDLLEAYRQRLQETGTVDFPEALLWLLEHPQERALPFRFLVFQGMGTLSPLLRRVLHRIIEEALQQGVAVWALVPVAPPFSDPPFLKLLRQALGATVVSLEAVRQPEVEGRAYAAQVDELREMAREIKTLEMQGDTPLRIGIVAPSLYDLLPVLRQVFHEYGLNVVVYTGDPLSHTPWARLWHLATQAVLRGFPTDTFEALVSSPHFRVEHRGALQRILRDRISVILLEGHLPYQPLAPEDRKRIEDLMQRLKTLLAPLAQGETQPLAQWVSMVRRFLQQFTQDMPPEVEQAFALALHTLERVEPRLRSPQLPASEFLTLWQTLLQNTRLPDPDRPEPEHPVHLMGMAEAQAFEGDLLYFVDASEHRLPSAGLLDRYLPHRVRQALEMPTEEQVAQEQEYRFQLLLQAPFQRVVVSYSQTDDQGRPVLPTLFADQVFPWPPPLRLPHQVYARGALSPAEAQLHTPTVLKVHPFSPTPQDLQAWLDRRHRELKITTLTQLADSCAYQVFLEQILELPRPPQRSLLPYVDEGTWFHTLLRRVFQRLREEFPGRLPSLEEFRAQYEAQVETLLQDTPRAQGIQEFLRHRSLSPVQALYDHLVQEVQENLWPDALELPVRLAFPEFDLTLTGRVDRVDRDGQRFRVLDYKTGKSKNPQASHSLQVLLYTEALKQEGGATPLLPQILYVGDPEKLVKNARILNKGDPNASDVHANLEKGLEQTKELIQQLLQAEFPPRANRWNCRSCAFREVCPYAQA